MPPTTDAPSLSPAPLAGEGAARVGDQSPLLQGPVPAVPAPRPGRGLAYGLMRGLMHGLARASNLATVAAVFVVWEAVARLWLPRVDPYLSVLMPAPTLVIATGWSMILSGELAHHLLTSLRREAVAFAFALTAIPVGVAMGWSARARAQLDPIVEILRPIPPLAWIPLSILWFGVGDRQNEFIIFLGMFFPILLNTVEGTRNVEPNLIRAARSLGAPEASVLWRVVLRAAMPQVVTGIRVGLGFGWMALVAAELVGADSGLGFLINDARSVLRTDIIMVGMLTIGLTGLLIDLAIRTGLRRFLPWSVPRKR